MPAALVFFFLSFPLLARAAAEEAPPEPQHRVFAGVYVNQVHGMNLRDNQFEVDFYLWFRWKEKDIDPLETFSLVNGRVDSKESVFRAQRGEWQYASCRIRATVIEYWDVSQYPLDGHDLPIAIEDNDREEEKLVYQADVKNCNYSPHLQVPGWVVTRGSAEVRSHTYRTNYGDPDLPSDKPSTYSRFIYTVRIERPGYGYFLKLFLGLFISVLLAFLALLIKPTNVDPRFGLGVGAIFAAVSLDYVIASSLPETNTVTMADKLHMIAFSFIFLTIGQSALSLKLCENEREGLSRSFDRWSFIVGLLIYAGLNINAVYKR